MGGCNPAPPGGGAAPYHPGVRRIAALIAVLAAAVGALVLVGGSGPAQAQGEGELSIVEDGAFLFVPYEDDTPVAERIKSYAAEQGRRYRFQIDYTVSGPGAIVTGHTFTIENAISGERQASQTKTFDPEPAGSYNESETVPVGDDWEPGVYRLEYRIFARAPGQTEVDLEGTRSFLVVP